ncbi:MAG: (d)CMP kinase, partial [Chloroflexi bacterium]|nr:(d)CMP kinase [Chloroflexota bacterium]
IDLRDESALTKLAVQARIDVTCQDGEGRNAVFISGFDVMAEVHTPSVEAGVSLVARVTGVRHALLAQQRRMAENGRIVMAGQDIVTTVLPQADMKLFLVASLEERARRRQREQREQGKLDNVDTLAELRKRDEIDSQRLVSPLRSARDARVIDTEDLTPQQVADQVIDIARGLSCLESH